MLRGVTICPDSDLSDRLGTSVSELGIAGILRTLDHYPNELELTRFLRAHAPQIVFLSIESMSRALEIVAGIEATIPGVQIIAISRDYDPQVLIEVMRSGIREFLAMPFQRQNVVDALLRVREILDKKPPAIDSTDLLFAFLPAKAGVGTTTIALNTAGAIARIPDTNVLLIDLDLNSGMLRFMLKLDNPYSLADAAERAGAMDEAMWPQLVTKLDNLDVLHAGKLNPGFRIEGPQIRYLLDFARRHYRAICVDLSGNMEKFSLEIMHEAKRVFLVCTPEIPSLHLAREKLGFLRSVDLGDRVSLLVNRYHKRSVITPMQIEELLGVPVHMTFPNNYQGVHKALTAGKYVESGSDLGKQYTRLAHSVTDHKAAAPIESRKRFLEYFSLLPARHSLATEGKKSN
ncbi:MAG: hypothetical protein IT160_03155 [Bryobacterales bacterium]|nr:hypothetical protein [Bryobacterales bacterium]